MPPMDDDTLLERSWEIREETLYKQHFGDTGPGICPLDMDLLHGVFQQEDIDPRWLHVGVFACPPHGERRHWVMSVRACPTPGKVRTRTAIRALVSNCCWKRATKRRGH